MLTYADVWWQAKQKMIDDYTERAFEMPYADVCWRMLTYADVWWQAKQNIIDDYTERAFEMHEKAKDVFQSRAEANEVT
jgi:hypothetical protein